MKITTRLKPYCAAALLTLLFVGCSHKGSSTQALSGEDYLKLANSASEDQKANYQIKAAEKFLSQQKPQKANTVLSALNNEALSPQQSVGAQLVSAKAQLLAGHTQNAIYLLQQAASSNAILTNAQQQQLHSMLANAYEADGNTAASILQRNELQNYLNDKTAKKQNLMAIWQSLQSLSLNQLKALSTQSPSANLQGWVTLAVITKQAHDPQDLRQSIATWKVDFPDHPALLILPKELNQSSSAEKRSDIALLLPLHGRYAASGQAVRNGFLAAYYHDKQIHPLKNTEIHIIDTSSGSIIEHYQEALNKGATTVVGPLLKSNLQTLITNAQLSVTTLALNTLPDYTNDNSNLFQFGLSPIDEALQTALYANKQGHQHALLITQNSHWGQTIANAFKTQWQLSKGQITAELQYDSPQNLTEQISKLLGIQLANDDYQQLHKLIGYKIRFLPRRRQDIDMIYLVAQRPAARQILPLLKFYYAGDLPTYTTSQAYSGHLTRQAQDDLNGMIFCDMPWVLTPNQLHPGYLNDIKQQIETVWPVSFSRHAKLYALGVDAYDLSIQLRNIQVTPQFAFKGATGKLYLDNNQHIYRQLSWAKLSHGKPKRL